MSVDQGRFLPGTLLPGRYRIVALWVPGMGATPGLDSSGFLLAARSAVGAWLTHVPYAVRTTLFFFFLLFLLRVLLRNQWLPGAAFVLIVSSLNALGSSIP